MNLPQTGPDKHRYHSGVGTTPGSPPKIRTNQDRLAVGKRRQLGLKNRVPLYHPTAFRVDDGTIQRMADRSHHLPSGISRELRIGVEGNDISEFSRGPIHLRPRPQIDPWHHATAHSGRPVCPVYVHIHPYLFRLVPWSDFDGANERYRLDRKHIWRSSLPSLVAPTGSTRHPSQAVPRTHRKNRSTAQNGDMHRGWPGNAAPVPSINRSITEGQ